MLISERPRISIPLTTTDKVLEIAALLLLIAFWSFTLLNYSQLPEIIPTHFNGSGKADDYGSKWTIFLLPGIATVLSVGLSILSRFPHLFNYTVEITEENAKRQYTIATQMIRVLKLALLLVFFAIDYKTVQTSLGLADELGSWFLPFTLVLVIFPILYFLIKSSKNS